MDFQFTESERAFQHEVRDFLAKNLPANLRRAHSMTPSVFDDPETTLPWLKILNAKGWVAPAWPKEYGGCGYSPAER